MFTLILKCLIFKALDSDILADVDENVFLEQKKKKIKQQLSTSKGEIYTGSRYHDEKI